jgi:hypothetical protein
VLPASSSQLFRFCQFDFSFPLGPADGRYLARAGEDELDVIVIKSLDAQRRGRFGGRRPKDAEPEPEPDSVSVSRVTVVDSIGFDDEADAREWLERCRKDEDQREESAANALRVVNRAIHAHRISAGDPYVRELIRDNAQTVRLGYGGGDDVADGRWRAAITLPLPRPRGRKRMLSPQEQMAAILSGRRETHPSEDVALRARLDLEQGRTREAAIQVRAAWDGVEGDLPSEKTQRVHDLAGAAGRGELDDEQTSTLTELLADLERVLRRRRHADS